MGRTGCRSTISTRRCAPRPTAPPSSAATARCASEIRLTYAELGERVDKIAAGLVERGVGRGDVVAFQLPNWWEFTALFYACNRIGAVANPLMPIFRQRELRFMMGFAEAKVAVVPALWRGFDHVGHDARDPPRPAASAPRARGRRHGRGVLREGLPRPPPVSEAEQQKLAALRPEPDEVVELIYTSGTSGEPKAVMHTANTVLAPAQCFIGDIPLTGRDVIFMGSPYAHQTGFLYGMLMPVMLKTTTVALDMWSAAEAAPMIEREGVTFSMGSTPFVSDMVNLAEEPRARVSRTLRTWVCAGAPIPRVLVQRAKAEMDLDVLSCWGMTENAGMTITRKSDPQEKVFSTDGRALPGTEARVVDDDKRPLPRRHRRQPAGARHHPFRRLPQEAAAQLDRRGRLVRHRRPRAHGQGRLHPHRRPHQGRDHPRRREHPRRRGREPDLPAPRRWPNAPSSPCPTRGSASAPAPIVVAKAGARLDLAELTRFLAKEGMAKTYWPERLELVADMPRTPSGKIQKFKLREAAAKLEAPLSPLAGRGSG